MLIRFESTIRYSFHHRMFLNVFKFGSSFFGNYFTDVQCLEALRCFCFPDQLTASRGHPAEGGAFSAAGAVEDRHAGVVGGADDQEDEGSRGQEEGQRKPPLSPQQQQQRRQIGQ